ncbi:MAG: recombination protein O N-terminal domain-containing protein [Candidatus Ureaplasma intestinipullorum]|uniref:Recombination protein O N-terminal domain-containing protein n=1 Tax=Candidatus Ureaplasma intestinipullorum TaxID=2838770 RepID=A0A9E2KVT0_9BACT|nr:recombination protein O N-terminal domain-containing protein [Candidatus Ureaplasma intestinipullorum]
MSINKINGYLIHSKDFNLYDQILTYITEDGFIKTFYALGVKKINSKNARSIKMGNFVEIEFFNSSKISKIKKICNINEYDFKKCKNLALLIMNAIIYFQKYIDKNIYYMYKEFLVLILREYNEYFLSIIIITKFTHYSYKYFSKFKTINYYYYDNLINKNSLKLNKSELDFLKNIYDDDITISNLYNLYRSTIDFINLFKKIYNAFKNQINNWGNKYE